MKRFIVEGRVFVLALATAACGLIACKKDDPQNNNNNNNTDVRKSYIVQIEQGATVLLPGEVFQYTAVLVDKDGNSAPVSGT
ncbi:MAG: hypothetical protein RMM53_04710, partial [Bacteroidia bacterium]|nr:hypothetical protein [Bacteroidia bacterium]